MVKGLFLDLIVNVVDAALNQQDFALAGSLNPSFPFHNREHPYFVSRDSHLCNFLPQ